ncbi:hypothetical protein BY996DRAFT_1904216 [Phakopsora pachyrhizi]|nr:hypothetical protein BY996DRAFT_1904216 [Phakopsora pachyrhizi]
MYYRTGVDRSLLSELTFHDRNKAKNMLLRKNLPETWKRELQLMLNMNKKAELQILCTATGIHEQSQNYNPMNRLSTLSSLEAEPTVIESSGDGGTCLKDCGLK